MPDRAIMRNHARAARLVGGIHDRASDVAYSGELNFPALAVDSRNRQSGTAGASQSGVGRPDDLDGAEGSRLAEDPDGLSGGFSGLQAVPQPVHDENEGAVPRRPRSPRNRRRLPRPLRECSLPRIPG